LHYAHTLFGAIIAGGGAFCAMFIAVFATFCFAGLAKPGADFTEFFYLITSQTHQLSGGETDSRAFHAKLYAFTHHFLIFFLRASRSAMVTYCRATKTCFYATPIGMIACHIE